MTIPSPEDFAEPCIENVGTYSHDLKGLYDSGFYDLIEGVTAERDSVIALLEKLIEVRRHRRREIGESKVAKWFYKQPCAEKASRKIYGSERSRPSEQEWITKRADWLLAASRDLARDQVPPGWWASQRKRINSQKEKEWRFQRRLKGFLENRQFEWELGVFDALRGYYYSDRWQEYYSELKSREHDLKAAKAGLEALSRIQNVEIGKLAFGFDEQCVKTLQQQVEEQKDSIFKKIYPVHRKDDIAKERMLIFELYNNNRFIGVGRKTSVINELMRLEGIDYAQETRTIERLVSKWSKAESHIRQKFRHVNVLTVGRLRPTDLYY